MDMGNGMSPADVAAVMGNSNNHGYGGGFGNGFGDGAWWIIILFLFAMNGGWGNGGYRGGNGGGGDIPYIINNTQNDIQRGFNQQATQSAIAALQAQVGNGFADAAVAQCQGNANITAAITNGQYATAQAITGAKDTINGTLNANQNATTAAMNQLAMSLQGCCCQQSANTADLKYTVATEACADRQAISDGLRDVIANNTANTTALAQAINNGIQSIKDDLCQDRLDAANRQIAQLQTQLNMANLAASQNAQTAQLIQDNNAQTAALIQRISPAPVPSYPVPNPYTGCCGNQGYYGCGCAG